MLQQLLDMSVAKYEFAALTFVVSMCNNNAIMTPQALQSSWTGGLNDSLQTYMYDVTYSQISVPANMNPILSVSVPCNGPAGNSFSTSSCTLDDLQGWSTYAESVAVQQGYQLSRYSHRILLLPPGNPCAAAGLSTQACTTTTGRCSSWLLLSDAGSPPLSNTLHEIGHTFGLSHSAVYGATWEQGDTSSLMGASAPMRCFAAPSLYQLGWTFQMQDVPLDSLQIGSWASFNLLSLGQAPSFLRLLPGSTGGHTYFISYRTAVGCDRSLDQQYTRKLSVHIYDQGTIAGTTGLSYLAALITPSQQWAPARVTPPTNVIIQLTSATQDGGATVGLCRYNMPSDCLPGRTNVPSYLPSDRCNMNGSCEAVFGEIGVCYDCMG